MIDISNLTLLEKAKLALRLSGDAFDAEVQGLIDAGVADLGLAGVYNAVDGDPIIDRVVITYCRLHFGSPDDYDRLKRSYDEQKAQLQMATGYGMVD